ncbi:MAG TPA: hypothetical protein VGT24_06140 [Candidatus Acidoferrales bacterium]|nr:hypothetical protein [Candidatus Acidoferrales bacterium]
MKIKSVVPAILVLLAMSFPLSARKNPPQPFFLGTPVTLNGAEIPEGMYELSVESNNSDVRVTLWKDGQFVATARGVWVKSGMKYKQSAVLLRVNSDGTRSVIEIRLAGAARSIVLNNPDSVLRISAKEQLSSSRQ